MKYCFLLFLISGCSLFIGGKESPKSAKGTLYSIAFNKPNWAQQIDKHSADYVFENMYDGRILLSNSFCDEFQESPLAKLAMKAFKTVKAFKSRISEYSTFQSREAYHLEGSGLVDGVQVHLRLLNTRRDNCYFDFIAITPEISFEGDLAFDDFLKNVVFK